MKRKFKVGDEIIVVNCSEGKHNDKKGVITKDEESECVPFKVKFVDGGLEWFEESEIELIEEPTPIKNTSLERLDELIKAVNTLGSLGVEVNLKITVEIDGKKVEL